MAATRARAFALLCLVAAARAGPKVRKPPKVELDESKLPPLESVLAELGVADVLPQLQAKGLDSTRQLCKWSRSDVSIHGMELGWSRDLQKANFKGSFLGRFPLVSADFWTSDHLSERSRSVDAFPGTRARGTLTLKRR